ncbi:unnamed protein product [Brassicogethes aeneus]|uniref:Uncharacterized protein n=1 Tax=Brassicogethes aeneus TaxID=1431903 RepID=A0A9P0FHP7_BRAAE|nr:unnamed protein product [Brassicogethes aeneus]
MCSKNVVKSVHPKDKGSWISLLTYVFVFPIFKKAQNKENNSKTPYEVPKFLETKKCGDELEKAIENRNRQSGRSSILTVLWCQYKYHYLLIVTPFLLIKIIKSMYSPILMSKFISYFKKNQTKTTLEQALSYNLSMFVIEIIYYLVCGQYNIWITDFSIKIRVALSSIIFRKVLKLSNKALANVGNVVSLMTKDVAIFERGLKSSQEFIVSIIHVTIICCLLYSKMGIISLSSILFLILMFGMQLLIGKYIAHIRVFIDNKTGERIKATKEVLGSLKVIKMLTWENFFLEKISKIRQIEVNSMIKDAYAKSTVIILGSLGPDMMIYLFVMSYFYMGVSVDAEIIFYMLTCVRSLRHVINFLLPTYLGLLADFKGSIKRINLILLDHEVEDKDDVFTDDPKILLRDFNVRINGKVIFYNISIKINKGVTSVIGANGSGKTTFLLSLLRETPHTGHLITQGRLSYASQEPWLFPGTIQENIIFGETYNLKKYNQTLHICGLLNDLNTLPKGDETVLINGGLNLSKGQQCRVNLARAIYRDSDIYLLDDCLASLDSKVQGEIVEELLKSFKDKICLIVTQNIDLMRGSDNVLLIDNSQIKYSKPDSLDRKDIENINYIIKENDEALKEEANETTCLISGNKDLYKESQKQGSVPLKSYLKYIKFGRGYFVFIFIIILFGLSQYSETFAYKTLTKWVDLEQKKLSSSKNVTMNELLKESSKVNMHYGILLGLAIFLTLVKILFFYDFTKTVSININTKLTLKMLKASLSFIDTNLLGNILNRFSQDLNNIDEMIPIAFLEVIRLGTSLFGTIILISLANFKLFIPILLLLITLVIMSLVCLPIARNLKRLETSTRSPFIGHINTTLDGIETIRALNNQKQQIQIFEESHNTYISNYYSLMLTFLAYWLYMNVTCLVIVYVIVWAVMFVLPGGSVGNIGIAFIEMFSMSKGISMALKQITDAESLMTSFERIVEYIGVTQEDIKGAVIETWPGKGSIEFHNVSLKYGEAKILNNVSFLINDGEKIGIIGRTGSGKSSLVSLLMRLYNYEGTIKIDNIDINTISIEHLRKNISFIPQDPILFSDNIRNNLDPLKLHSDHSIWNIIETLKIKHLVPTLYNEITTLKLSSGEKQLLCLARAMLRKTKILIMDESTANIDSKTELILKNILSQHFLDCTIITIAHKVSCISDCDRILKLDNGVLWECTDEKKFK